MKGALFLTITIFLSSICLADRDARISEVKIYDKGNLSDSGVGIDLVQDNCEASGEETNLEGFYDTVLGITVTNESNQIIRFRRARIIIRNADGNGRKFKTKRLGFIGSGEVMPNGGQTELYTLFMDIQDRRKTYGGADFFPISDPGFKNFRIRIRGRDGGRNRFRLRTRASASFDNFNRCNESTTRSLRDSFSGLR